MKMQGMLITIALLVTSTPMTIAQPNRMDSVHLADSLIALADDAELSLALALCQEALDASQRISYKKGEAAVSRVLARLNIYEKEYYTAFLLLSRSVHISQQLMDSAGLTQSKDVFDLMSNKSRTRSDALPSLPQQRTLSDHHNYVARLREMSARVISLNDVEDEMGLKKHRWQIFTIISVSFVLILLFGKYIDMANRRKQLLISKLGSFESRALKAQMNPHFIFNSLNSIQALIANDNQSEAMLYVSKFSKLLRSIIENSNRNLIPLQNELNNLKFYIELESLRLNFDLSYSIDVDPKISAEFEMIPPLIIQPLVENALWHGLNGKSGMKELRVRVDADGDLLRFVVADNGIGRVAARKTSGKASTGVGLFNTERRITLLNDKVVNDSFRVEDLKDQKGVPTGTKVIFKVRRTRG